MAIFGGINTPYVNEVTLKRLLVPKVKENIFQKVVFRPEEAATEKFSTDTAAAELQVIRVKPNNKYARNIGADINGDYFNADTAVQSTTEAYGVKILTSIDYNIDIPQSMQDMVSVDMAEAELTNLAGKVAQNINAVTGAAQLATLLNHAYTNSDTSHIITLGASPTGTDIKDAIIDANSALDAGNEAQGIDSYPREQRAILVRNSANALLKKGGIIIGGSNYGQDILQRGGLDKDTRPNNVEGYLGEVDSVPVYLVSDPIFNLMAKYLGLVPTQLSKVWALVCSSIGTGRALAFNAEMKIIDAPGGQGRRLQPKYRYGAECWDAKSVVAIVANGFTNPSTGSLTVVAPGSRITEATATFAGGTGSSGTAPTAIASKYLSTITLPDNTFTVSGKTFNGWTSSYDNVKYDAGASYLMPLADVTFTATWKA